MKILNYFLVFYILICHAIDKVWLSCHSQEHQ